MFEGANKVTIIKLDNNEINNVDENTFERLGTLQTLTLSSNLIKKLPQKFFTSLVNLKLLDLSSNLLSTLPGNIFDTNRFLERIKFAGNRLIFIPTLTVAETTYYDMRDNLCVNKIFERTSKLNSYTRTSCSIELEPVKLFELYKTQSEINAVCADKNTLVTLGASLNAIKQKKFDLEKEKENLEHEVTKIKIYKNSMC